MTAKMSNTSCLNSQVGGDHYRNFKIQPLEFILANNIPFCEGNIIKYLMRKKGSRLEDLRKAKHYLDILIEQEENEGRDNSVRA